ncbi:hypothetical protein [Nocardia wallacei]|uniref:hypothetical protein n=1 Tax=Nocardia wallacei TaxID=480035 RepID=UPI0024588DDD|nr:hypothetical protein [Nocardia wallacei]
MPSLAVRLHDVIAAAQCCDTAEEADRLAARFDRLVRELQVGAHTGDERVRLVRLCADAGTAVRDALSRTRSDGARPPASPPESGRDEPATSLERLYGLPPQRARYRSRDWEFYRRTL